MTLQTVTVSSGGQPMTLPDGVTPIEGKLVFAAPDLVTVPGQNAVLGGSVVAELDGGVFTATLVANDVATMSPSGWTCRVTGIFSNAPGWVRYIALPQATASVALADVLIADPVTGVVAALLDQTTADTRYVKTTVADAAYVSTKAGVWRRRDMPPLALQKMLYSQLGGTCTLTIAQTTTPTSGYVKYAPSPVALSGSGNTADQYGPFTYAADEIALSVQSVNYVVSASIDPHTTANPQGCLSVAFGTDADIFQVRLLPQAATDTVRIFVDGTPVQDLPVLLTSIATYGAAGNGHMLTVNLGSSAPRRIRIEIGTARFGGIYQHPNYDMWMIGLHGPKVAVLGDSTSGGSSVNTGAGGGTWFPYFCDLLGWENRWNQARGGTGYTTTNSPYTTLPNRVALDVVGKAFDLVIVDAGYNDAINDQTAFQTAVSSTISAIKAGLPNAMVIGVGCYSTSGTWPPYATTAVATPLASSVTKDAWQQAVFQQLGIPYISQITGAIRDKNWTLVDTIGPWVTGSGRVGALSGYGSADRFIGDTVSDTVHPTNVAHKAKALWMTNAVRKLLAI